MIFVDTGALIATYLKQDQHHKSAIRKWEKIRNSDKKYFTSAGFSLY